jgi:hypothetical protein
MRFIRLALQRAGFIRTIIETFRQSAASRLSSDVDASTREEAVNA